jgi:hypothetical protein
MLDWSEPATPAPMPAARHQPIIALAVADATGLGTIARGASRVSVDDKAMINCRADVNQLLPLKYKWAWEKYLDGCNNHWMPTEVSMQADNAPSDRAAAEGRRFSVRAIEVAAEHTDVHECRVCRVRPHILGAEWAVVGWLVGCRHPVRVREWIGWRLADHDAWLAADIGQHPTETRQAANDHDSRQNREPITVPLYRWNCGRKSQTDAEKQPGKIANMAVQADLTRVTHHRCALRNAQQPGASMHEAGHTDRHLQSSSFDVLAHELYFFERSANSGE